MYFSLQLWHGGLQGFQIVICTGNDGVREALIACQSESANCEPILEACLRLECNFTWNLWLILVADEPSRGQCKVLVIVAGCGLHQQNFPHFNMCVTTAALNVTSTEHVPLRMLRFKRCSMFCHVDKDNMFFSQNLHCPPCGNILNSSAKPSAWIRPPMLSPSKMLRYYSNFEM